MSNPDRNSLVYVYEGTDGPADGDVVTFDAATGRWKASQSGTSVPPEGHFYNIENTVVGTGLGYAAIPMSTNLDVDTLLDFTDPLAPVAKVDGWWSAVAQGNFQTVLTTPAQCRFTLNLGDGDEISVSADAPSPGAAGGGPMILLPNSWYVRAGNAVTFEMYQGEAGSVTIRGFVIVVFTAGDVPPP